MDKALDLDLLHEHFGGLIAKCDVLITCGGIIDGDKDLTMRVMDNLGIEKKFHRVRIGPGKGACMGRVGNSTVFNLPGGLPPTMCLSFLTHCPGHAA